MLRGACLIYVANGGCVPYVLGGMCAGLAQV